MLLYICNNKTRQDYDIELSYDAPPTVLFYEVKYGEGKDLCPRTVFVVVFTYICNNETRENYDIELSCDD